MGILPMSEGLTQTHGQDARATADIQTLPSIGRCAPVGRSALQDMPAEIAGLQLYACMSALLHRNFNETMSLLSLSRPPSHRMKRTSLLVFALLGSVALRAQEESDHSTAPPPENLTFLTDEYIYIPKYKFSLGLRLLSGSKTSFSGRGVIASASDYLGDMTSTNYARTYHDGTVGVDTRTISTDDGNGGIISVPISPDGKTSNWTYVDASQVTPAGNIAMHAYSADTIDTGSQTKDTDNAYGFEVTVARDMGKIANRFEWNLAAGFSLNDLKAGFQSTVPANIATITDVYSLEGAPAPGVGTALSTLLDAAPLSRTTAVTPDSTSVTNSWKLKGAYYTFRAGPTLFLPITAHLRASVSAGAALVYAGTTYIVTQSFQPVTGDPILATTSDSSNHFLPGFYADANVEYSLTDTAGFYAGAVYQNTGKFTQEAKTDTADFFTKVDMSSLAGLRAGLNIKF